MIGILGSQEEEISLLRQQLEGRIDLERGPYIIHKGVLRGKNVLLALSGNGKVNAAAMCQLIISEGAKKIIFTGVAGGLLKKQKFGDMVIATDTVQHDMDVTALGYHLGEIPGDGLAFESDKELLDLAFEAAKKLEHVQVSKGRVLTGDKFINSEEESRFLRETFEAACVEMEGAAVGQIATKWKIPFVIIRSLSDTAGSDSHMDFKEFIDLAAKNAKIIVLDMLEAI